MLNIIWRVLVQANCEQLHAITVVFCIVVSWYYILFNVCTNVHLRAFV